MWRRYATLVNKILLPVTICLIASVVCVGLFSSRMAQNQIVEHLLRTQHDFVTQMERNFDNTTSQMVTIISTLHYDEELYHLLSAQGTQTYTEPYIGMRVRQILGNVRLFSSDPNISLYLYDYQGRVFKHTSFSSTTGIISDALTLSPYKAVRDAPDNPITWLSATESLLLVQDTPCIHAVKALNHLYRPEGVGLLVVEIKESSLYLSYRDSLSRGDVLYIVDRDGTVISSSDRAVLGQTLPFWEEMPVTETSGIASFRIAIDGKECIVVAKRNTSSGWYVVDLLSYGVLLEAAQGITRFAILMALLCLAICLPLILLSVRHVIRPIRALNEHMLSQDTRMQMLTAEKNASSEIAELYDGYNQMVRELLDSIREANDWHEAKQKAEMQALQAQINPHFLHNTLLSIRYLTANRKTDEAETMVIALSHLLRGVLGKSDTLIPLSQEVVFVKDYFHILNMRYDGRVSLNIHVAKECEDTMIPRLLLQPIVENALLHGIGEATANGIISLYAYRPQDRVRIEVMDNGQGMRADRLKVLQEGMEFGMGDEMSHIGLKNVRDRLLYTMGPSARLDIVSVEGAGTSVTLDIPYIQRPERG